MGAITESVGGGLLDAANQSITLTTTAEVLSSYSINSSSTYVSGGFDSLGNSYTTRPIGITDITLVIGRSGSANVGIRPAFKTSISTNSTSIVNSSVIAYTGLLPVGGDSVVSTESTYVYPAFTGGPGYYGFRALSSGAMEYGSGGSGSIIVIYNGGTSTLSSSQRLSGTITQASIPSPPLNPNVLNITDTTATITWSAPTDDGMQSPPAYSAANIKGYRINYRNSSSENWKVLVANTGSNTLSTAVNGLSPSTYYEIEVAALNAVTDAHTSGYTSITAHVGSRSVTKTFTTAVSTNNVRIWDGSEFKKSIIKIWDGSSWIQYPFVRAKVWDGTTTTRTNLIENPNFETNTTNWSGYFGYISRVTTTPQRGTYCLQASPDGDGDISVKYYKANALTLGISYRVGVYVRISSYDQVVSVTANFGDGASASTSFAANTAWQYVELPATVATTTTDFYLTISSQNSGFDGYIYIDSVILEKASTYSGYFDGNTSDAGGIDYAWTGTANASTSTAVGEPLAVSLGFKNLVLDS